MIQFTTDVSVIEVISLLVAIYALIAVFVACRKITCKGGYHPLQPKNRPLGEPPPPPPLPPKIV